MSWIMALNYLAWFVFVFIAVVWLMTLLQNSGSSGSEKKKPLGKLPSVSVLIPAYNEEATVAKTIRSVLNLDYPRRLMEIIVINDCSTDRTKQIASRFKRLGVGVLSNKKNMGKAWSLNRGIDMARGKLIATIDADSTVESNALKLMVAPFSDPLIASVTPNLKVWKPGNFLEKIQFVEYLLNVFIRKMLAFLDSIHVTPGAFSVYRKSVLNEIGGFSPGNLTEDMDIALKIHRHGYRIENNMDAITYTCCPAKFRGLVKQRIRWYRGAIQNIVKHRDMFFNRKYGNLGLFFMPTNVISVAAIVVIFVVLGWSFLTTISSSLWKMHLVNWDVAVFFGSFDLPLLITMLFSTTLLFSIIGLALGGGIIYKSFCFSSEKIKSNKPHYFVYLILYPFMLMLFWLVAIFYEALKIERKW